MKSSNTTYDVQVRQSNDVVFKIHQYSLCAIFAAFAEFAQSFLVRVTFLTREMKKKPVRFPRNRYFRFYINVFHYFDVPPCSMLLRIRHIIFNFR